MQLTDNIKSFYVYLFERNRKIMPFRFFSNSFCQFIYPSILLLSITNMIIIHTKHGGGGGLCSTPVSSPWVFKEVSETTEDFCDLGGWVVLTKTRGHLTNVKVSVSSATYRLLFYFKGVSSRTSIVFFCLVDKES